MDITGLMAEYVNAEGVRKEEIAQKIAGQFMLLSPAEQEQVQAVFLKNLKNEVDETKELVKELDLRKTLDKVSRYISMSYISKEFFGKSRQWLNNRIKGNVVNGRPARFTEVELKKLSTALDMLSAEIKETSLQLNN
jgi:hypothetical protein